MSQGSPDDSWFRAALEGADLAAWVWDVAADRVTLSESWADIIGAVRNETITSSRELASLVHPDDLPQVLSLLEAAVRGRSLGLAICKAIAEQMHGRVGFEPAEGGGAVFWFELPRA